MQTISNICGVLTFMAIFAIPVLFIIFIIRGCMKKSKKWFGIAAAICAGSIMPLAIIGSFTDPATYCDHAYSIVEEVATSCAKRGKITKECSLCETRRYEYIDKVPHTWETDSVVSATCTQRGKIITVCSVCDKESTTYTDKADHDWETSVVEVTCTSGGYTTNRCVVCDYTKKTDTKSALGHDMKEVCRKEATQDAAGEIVYQCSRCDKKDVKAIEKLPKPTETNTPIATTEPPSITTEPPTTEHSEATRPSETEPAPTEPEVTFDEIYKAYKRNELAADDLYKGNRYKITAIIDDIESDGLFNLTGGATLMMEVKVGDTIVFFFAEFEKEQEEALKKVAVGDSITFEGTCSSAGYWYDCEIVR